MRYMFNGCKSLKKLDLSNFNTNNLEEMNDMFSNCYSLTELNISSFNTDNVKCMKMMFFDCSSLKELNINKSFIKERLITSKGNVFSGCPKIFRNKIQSIYPKIFVWPY